MVRVVGEAPDQAVAALFCRPAARLARCRRRAVGHRVAPLLRAAADRAHRRRSRRRATAAGCGVIYRVRHVTTLRLPDAGRSRRASRASAAARAAAAAGAVAPAVHAAPAVSWRRDGSDHFGNEVTWLFLDVAHAAFEVTAEATVDVAFPAPPRSRSDAGVGDGRARSPGRPAVPRPGRRRSSCSTVRWRRPTPRPAAYAAPSFSPGRPVLAALLELNARIRRDFTFRPASRRPARRLREVLRRREGVCQDFAHLMISALRAFGLPARYVSGYIRTRPSRGQAAPARRRSVACLGRVLAGAGAWLARSRSDQRHRGAGRACGARLGPRLRRRHAAARRHPGRLANRRYCRGALEEPVRPG